MHSPLPRPSSLPPDYPRKSPVVVSWRKIIIYIVRHPVDLNPVRLPGKFDQAFLLRLSLDFLSRPELGVHDERVLVLTRAVVALVLSPPPQGELLLALVD